MPHRRLHLLAYDIASPARLRRALHTVRAHAVGGQKSAHECFLTEAERHALLARLRRLIHPRADRVLALRLDPRLGQRSLGIARPPADGPFLIVG
ncbi:CRISPR-associated endonuclease Cas2 [Caldovatus aquaticus]|uniref:CRISPR-associated endoribonuclease Cas2 n=1 Tax=Caldovatus aquaticus TaxID=2865671 RepID=A0ABS7F0D7_9PROT|nr:CRISPR-associated endonuclease Cas2 [Caldovatus aquaticus]MBW8269024.1 CRISPR-associated endonuclease Cas2 [Caldovatus aquaticus]